jgi:uncharacterized protein
MKPVVSLWCALALLACEPVDAGQDAGLDAGPALRLRVATFNVKLFFDTMCQSGQCAAGDFEQVLTPQAFDARANELSQAIMGFDADVVSLQELETQACLDAILRHLTGALPHGALGEIGSSGSVDVAILSKTPLERVVGHRSEPLFRPDGTRTTFSREFLEVHVRAANGTEVVVFAAHFRSKSSDDPGRRLAEAQTSRRIVTELATAQPEALVVMAGDLNDTPGSPPMEALTADGGLLRVAADLPIADQYTYIFNGRGEAIDHILQAVTPAAFAVPRSTIVWKNSRGFAGSDHYAVTSDFEFP